MKIGLFGFLFNSENMGCAALACSMLDMLEQIGREENLTLEYIVFEPHSNRERLETFEEEMHLSPVSLTFSEVAWVGSPACFAHPGRWLQMKRNIRSCDVVIDITGGDSFSDIYGMKRFLFWSNIKKYILDCGIPLILAPQTYGPFDSKECRSLASQIINAASLVIARDQKSAKCVRELCGREPEVTTDIALRLPYEKPLPRAETDKRIRVGINLSGLLYSQHSDTQLVGVTLSTNYQLYIEQLIEWLLAEGCYSVTLISHVKSDEYAVEQVAKKYPACTVVPFEQDPMKMKQVIAGLDVFLGSRMHATVGAFSAGVATIPVAYSRKFAGLYENLDYDVLVDLETVTQAEALEKTCEYIRDYETLHAKVQACAVQVRSKTEKNYELICEFLKQLEKRGLKK